MPNTLTQGLFPIIILLMLGFFFSSYRAEAQITKPEVGILRGVIKDKQREPIPGVSVGIPDTPYGTSTNGEGRFELVLPARKEWTVQVNAVSLGFEKRSFKVILKPDETQVRNFILKVSELLEVEIIAPIKDEYYDTEEREEVSTLKLNPTSLKEIPNPFGDAMQALVVVGAGITTNSELSSAYSVRGGNFDENLVYVNGIEVYRPFLVRAGQQEGLSFVNLDLVGGVEFSSGGWQPKYGDKLSSVLNIDYKKPEQFKATATAGLLGGAVHAEGSTKNRRFRYLTGVRHRDGRYLFNTLEVNGQYLPVFTDVQNYFNFDFTKEEGRKNFRKTELGVLVSYARNRYQVIPEDRETTFGTFNNQIRLFVNYEGEEVMNYDTYQGGFNLTRRFNKALKTEFIGSAVQTSEREYINVEGAYRLCDVDTDVNSDNFNKCALVRGAGRDFRYARNRLDASIYSLRNRTTWKVSRHTEAEFGIRYNREIISDRLDEYTFLDSADFVRDLNRLRTNISLETDRWNAYAQNTHRFSDSVSRDSSLYERSHTITYGLRASWWSLNEELLFSPRLQYAFRPAWESDVRFTAAVGVYRQPPFYRELRDFEGQINEDLLAQSSVHAIVGFDKLFYQWGRPFKFMAEAYYKYVWNLVPYDVDNVRLRYYADNAGTASVTGADFRVNGEFIKGTESWFSLSFLSAREDVDFDEQGSIRRPSDQRVTATIFFQDHLPRDPSIRMYLRLLFGSGLPFGPPDRPEFRSALNGPQYRRVDIGFSKLITYQGSSRRKPESLWIGLEMLNLLGVENVISYTWVNDFVNDLQFAVPNSLSQRFLNLKVVLRY